MDCRSDEILITNKRVLYNGYYMRFPTSGRESDSPYPLQTEKASMRRFFLYNYIIAGLVQWQYICFPSKKRRFDSGIPLQNQTFCKFAVHFGGGAKHRPSRLPHRIKAARRAQARLAVGQNEVRLPCDLILSRICFTQS